MNMPPAHAMDVLARLYRRSLARGQDFDLDMDWIYEVLDPATHCYYSGDVLSLAAGTVAKDSDRTVDRVDNKKGYTKDNVVICSHKYNQLKSQFESGEYDSGAVFKMLLKMDGMI